MMSHPINEKSGRYQKCKVIDCEQIVGMHGALGMCVLHYRRSRANGRKPGHPMTLYPCTINEKGCWLLPPQSGSRGRPTVWINGRFKNLSRVILENKLKRLLFNKTEACHTCDNPPCVNPDHLFEGTHRENMLDAMHKNRLASGERAPRSKLVVAQVREIKNKLQSGATFRHLAEEYRVSPRNIRSIAQGRIWKQVENGFRIAQL